MAGQRRPMIPGRGAGRDVDHRGHREFPGQPAHEQVQQMRWPRDSTDRLLQVRCAIYNGTFGAGLGRRLDRLSNADLAFKAA